MSARVWIRNQVGNVAETFADACVPGTPMWFWAQLRFRRHKWVSEYLRRNAPGHGPGKRESDEATQDCGGLL